jgi:hypothetical protein
MIKLKDFLKLAEIDPQNSFDLIISILNYNDISYYYSNFDIYHEEGFDLIIIENDNFFDEGFRVYIKLDLQSLIDMVKKTYNLHLFF